MVLKNHWVNCYFHARGLHMRALTFLGSGGVRQYVLCICEFVVKVWTMASKSKWAAILYFLTSP